MGHNKAVRVYAAFPATRGGNVPREEATLGAPYKAQQGFRSEVSCAASPSAIVTCIS